MLKTFRLRTLFLCILLVLASRKPHQEVKWRLDLRLAKAKNIPKYSTWGFFDIYIYIIIYIHIYIYNGFLKAHCSMCCDLHKFMWIYLYMCMHYMGLRVFCVGNSCFLRRWLVLVFFATVPVGGVFCNGGGCFCDGPGGRACFLRRLVMFFALVGCVFCVGGVFCDGNPCFLRRLAQSPSSAWRPEEVMFFATVPASVW